MRDRPLDERGSGNDIRLVTFIEHGRRRHQLLEQPGMARQMLEAEDRILLRREGRNAGRGKGPRHLLAAADPYRQHRLARRRRGTRLGHGTRAICRVVRRERGVERQHGVDVALGQQAGRRVAIVLRRPDDHRLPELAVHATGPPQPRCGQGRQPLAIADDRQPAGIRGAGAAQRLGGGKKLVEIVDAQQASPMERGIMRRVAGHDQGGMRQGRPRRLQARRPQHQHRLEPRGSARRREKARGVSDVVDRKQDRTRRGIGAEMIEAVGDIDIGTFAKDDGARKPDPAPGGPGQDSGRHGIGLRDEGERTRGQMHRNRSGVQAEARRGKAERRWPDQPDSRRPGCVSQARSIGGVSVRHEKPGAAAFDQP